MQTLIMISLQEEMALFLHACAAKGLATAAAAIGRLAAVRVPDLGLNAGDVKNFVEGERTHGLEVSRVSP